MTGIKELLCSVLAVLKLDLGLKVLGLFSQDLTCKSAGFTTEGKEVSIFGAEVSFDYNRAVGIPWFVYTTGR